MPNLSEAPGSKMEAGHCPTCGKAMSGHTAVDLSEAVPEDGDLAVCFYCAEPLAYVRDGDGLRLVKCLMELIPNAERTEMQRAITCAKLIIEERNK